MDGSVPNIPDEELVDRVLIQGVWGGFGQVFSAIWKGQPVVVKHYAWHNPDEIEDPIQKEGLLRKINSYNNELAFYNSHFQKGAKAAQLLGLNRTETSMMLILDDGKSLISEASHRLNEVGIASILQMLAELHASTLLEAWGTEGNYWHYGTRKAEWHRIRHPWLKSNAGLINQKLQAAKYTCLIHGDSKPSNYLTSNEPNKIVALDFQYFGKGIGVMDLVCFCSGVIPENDLAGFHVYLTQYFAYLEAALEGVNSPHSYQKIKEEWASLIPLVWADYARFLEGWAPGSFKLGKLVDLMVARAQELLRN